MVEPYIDLAHVAATTGSFAETGGNAALSGASKTESQTYATLGLRASLAELTLEGVGFTPRIDLGWQHALGSFRPGQVVSFQSLSQSFTVLGVPLSEDAAAARVGFDLAVAQAAILSFDYDGSFSSRVQNNAIRASLSWRF